MENHRFGIHGLNINLDKDFNTLPIEALPREPQERRRQRRPSPRVRCRERNRTDHSTLWITYGLSLLGFTTVFLTLWS